MTDAANTDIANIKWLQDAEKRLATVKRYHPESLGEIARLTAVCDEITGRCSAEALDAYRNPTAKVLTAAEKKAAADAELAAMEANRDRPSI